MAKAQTPTIIKNKARITAFDKLKVVFSDYDFIQVGDSEIAVPVDTAPTGETIYALFSPTIKDYCERKTPNKTLPAYDPMQEGAKYLQHVAERIENEKANAERKNAKIERDKKAREKARQRREEKGQ